MCCTATAAATEAGRHGSCSIAFVHVHMHVHASDSLAQHTLEQQHWNSNIVGNNIPSATEEVWRAIVGLGACVCVCGLAHLLLVTYTAAKCRPRRAQPRCLDRCEQQARCTGLVISPMVLSGHFKLRALQKSGCSAGFAVSVVDAVCVSMSLDAGPPGGTRLAAAATYVCSAQLPSISAVSH